MKPALTGLKPFRTGGGIVEFIGEAGARMTIPPKPTGYADAQLDDTQRLPRARFRARPPMRIHLRARTSLPTPIGTLGFGLWNDPFTVSIGQGGAARRFPAAPQALWFFYGSPPNDLAFSAAAPGAGWKAVSLRSPAVPGWLLAPGAALALGISRLPGLARPVINLARRTLTAAESELQVELDQWHTYSLSWQPGEAVFSVDDAAVLVATNPPAGPLGFVTWIDNQYASLSTQSGLRFGRIPTSDAQSLEIQDFQIEYPE